MYSSIISQVFDDFTTLLECFVHSNACVSDKVDSSKNICKNVEGFVIVIPLETKNFKQSGC